MATCAHLSSPLLITPPPLHQMQSHTLVAMMLPPMQVRRQRSWKLWDRSRHVTYNIRSEENIWSPGTEKEPAVPMSVPVRVAHEMLQAGHRYLDVRTEDEFNAGHAAGAVNIPYMYKAGSGMTKNPNFLEQVSSVFGEDDEIIIGCQLGKRSLMAATELCSAGFTAVTDISGGFSAWIQNGLPIDQ